MKKKDVLTILLAHADGLNRGDDQTERLTEQYVELGSLFELARAIKHVLVPVRAPAGFTTQLRQELMQANIPAPIVQPPRRNVWVGAAVGSALSIAGLIALFLLRRQRTPLTV